MAAADKLHNRVASSLLELSTALRALSLTDTEPTDDVEVPELSPGLPESFTSLLSQLRQIVTHIGIAFKPPAATVAAMQQLDKLDHIFGALCSCVIAASGGHPWSVSQLASEWRDGILTIGGELDRLLHTVADDIASHSSVMSAASSRDENPYIRQIGVVWDTIDAVVKDVSSDEVGATRKWWSAQDDVIKDAWEEFKDALETEGDENPIDCMDGDDDSEWAELERGFEQTTVMDEQERATAELAKPLLSLHLLLHRSIPRYLGDMTSVPLKTFLPQVRLSSLFVAAYDTAISSLTPRQDSQNVTLAMSSLDLTAQQLVTTLRSRAAHSHSTFIDFLDKWENRAHVARESWEERSMSLSNLRQGLEDP